jgi:hypothetical protein
MAVEVIGSFGDAKDILKKEMDALQQLAEKVENGSLKFSKKLQRRFASAHYALARVHCLRQVDMMHSNTTRGLSQPSKQPSCTSSLPLLGQVRA